MDNPSGRPPRPKRPREVLRTAIEVAAVGVLAIVVLTLLGVVLYKGRERQAPPQRRARGHADAGLRVARSRAGADAGGLGARVRDVREAPELSGCRRVSRHAARSRGGVVAAAGLTRPPDVQLRRPARLALQQRRAGHRPLVHACVRACALCGARVAGRAVSPRSSVVEGARPHADDPAAHARARLHAAPRAAVLLRGADLGAEPSRSTRCRRPARSRSSATGRAARWCFAATRTTTGRATRTCSGSSTTSARSPRRSASQLERGDADYGVVTPSAFAALAQRFKDDNAAPARRAAADRRVPRAEHGAPALQGQPVAAARRQLRARPSGARAALRPATARSRATSTCPPGFPGYQSQHVYPVGAPDLAKARALARGHLRGGHAVFLACGSQDCAERAIVVADALKKIGLHVRIDVSPGQFTLAGVRGTALRHRRRDHAARLRRPVRASREAARRPRDPGGRQQQHLVLRNPR